MSELNKLRWKCRRGMKELDDLLLNFLQHHYPQSGTSEQEAFERILDMPDPELYFLILGKTEAGDRVVSHVIEQLRQTRS